MNSCVMSWPLIDTVRSSRCSNCGAVPETPNGLELCRAALWAQLLLYDL